MLINISIPDSIILSTRQSYEQFELEAKKAIALKFYIDEKLSLGQAAELSGLNKFEFMKFLGQNKVSVFRFEDNDYSIALQNDVSSAEAHVND